MGFVFTITLADFYIDIDTEFYIDIELGVKFKLWFN